jgi:hypothetical protein
MGWEGMEMRAWESGYHRDEEWVRPDLSRAVVMAGTATLISSRHVSWLPASGRRW